ncbi:nucleotidyltransferase family protein [Magnetospirillum sp. UT-4]|uniref:nucleotidyltransferase family protein n=1 Tax=Magnetospirillum sp. UT-4 TaxID=2681467 RepID=UPI001384367D|nr:nucleotidyltransferase domain-containing protein [Magnetospirillum sp. UT-4]CAA7620744.1 DNA polymerase [Magnetospirillum sp. UT-4]
MARLDDILAILRAHQDELKARGVLHAGVFGSVARGEETEDSDVDVALDLDCDRPMGLLRYNALGDYLESLVGTKVDMADRTSVRARLRAEIERDYKHAF